MQALWPPMEGQWLHLQGMQHSAMYMEMQAQQLRARLQDKITTADAIINTLEELIRERVQLQNTIADMERDAPPNTKAFDAPESALGWKLAPLKSTARGVPAVPLLVKNNVPS